MLSGFVAFFLVCMTDNITDFNDNEKEFWGFCLRTGYISLIIAVALILADGFKPTYIKIYKSNELVLWPNRQDVKEHEFL